MGHEDGEETDFAKLYRLLPGETFWGRFQDIFCMADWWLIQIGGWERVIMVSSLPKMWRLLLDRDSGKCSYQSAQLAKLLLTKRSGNLS